MIALTSITGKLGSAVLASVIEHNLISPSKLILCTSSSTSDPRWDNLKSRGAQLRKFDFNAPSPSTFAGCSKLFLVSTPDISLDFNDAPDGKGREGRHIAAIEAAVAAGVKHVYYTSLAFGPKSEAGVMRAHLRTEKYLHDLEAKGELKITIIREGLYNESWPLYLGYFEPKSDERKEIVLAGDGKVSWTAVKDMGLGTAVMVTDEGEKWVGKTVYLSNPPEMAMTMGEVAGLVGVKVKVVGREEYEEYYVGRGVEKGAVEWWSTSYAALEAGECDIRDGTLGELLKKMGVVPKPMEETVREMNEA